MKPSTLILAQFLLVALSASAAGNHALLIGVGAYKGVKGLDGPPNDVASIRSLLIDKFGYSPRFVHTLVDQQATKQAILQAMQNLVNEVKPGDYVFFYYSGHGTSFYDKTNAMTQAIGDDTGASLPVDFDRSSLEAFKNTVLLGRELRPFFTALDAKAQVFAVYDSCYSQDAMKAVPSPHAPVPKYVGAPKGDATTAAAAEEPAPPPSKNPPLPYQHMIALSAAKKNQAAVDLDAQYLKYNPKATLDGNPHGQLTNALLLGLQGAADKNHDGIITHEELFNYVEESSTAWSHNPKLRISADSSAALQQPVFGNKQIVRDTVCRNEPDHLPCISAPADLLSELGKGFSAVSEGWDVKVVPSGPNAFSLYDAGGILMNSQPMTRTATLNRLRSEQVLEKLSAIRYCQQKFNIRIDVNLSDQNEARSPAVEFSDLGKFESGQNLYFSAKLDRAAYLLVIDIDQEGGVTVVYPDKKIEKLPAGETTLRQTVVTNPFGVDLIKAFAFENKPAGLERFTTPANNEPLWIHPGDPALDALLKMVATDSADRSETKLRLITSPK